MSNVASLIYGLQQKKVKLFYCSTYSSITQWQALMIISHHPIFFCLVSHSTSNHIQRLMLQFVPYRICNVVLSCYYISKFMICNLVPQNGEAKMWNFVHNGNERSKSMPAINLKQRILLSFHEVWARFEESAKHY